MIELKENLYILNINEISEDDISFVKERFIKRYESLLKKKNKEDFLRGIGAYILLTKVFKDFSEDDIFYVGSKPHIAGQPYFNYSHSGEYVVLGVGLKEIGVDIEKIDDANTSKIKKFLGIDLDSTTSHIKWNLVEAMIKCKAKNLTRYNISKINEDEFKTFSCIYDGYSIGVAELK